MVKLSGDGGSLCDSAWTEDVEETIVSFGSKKSISVLTLNGSSFHRACLTDAAGDMTGLRVYGASQILGLFLMAHPNFVEGKSCVELGCGVGALGLLVSSLGSEFMCCTDGTPMALDLARLNMEKEKNMKLAVKRLRWGNTADLTAVVSSGPYDICLCADLMYYSIDLPLLLETARALTHTASGVIIFSHIFRVLNMRESMIVAAQALGLALVSVPLASFCDEEATAMISSSPSSLCLMLVYRKGACPPALEDMLASGLATVMEPMVDGETASCDTDEEQGVTGIGNDDDDREGLFD